MAWIYNNPAIYGNFEFATEDACYDSAESRGYPTVRQGYEGGAKCLLKQATGLYYLTLKVIGSGKAILTSVQGVALTVFSGESKSVTLNVGDTIQLTFMPDQGATFIKACDFLECQTNPSASYTILQPMSNTITAEFTVSQVIVNILKQGLGTILSSSGINQLAERSSIYVKVGDELYLQANAAAGYKFQKWVSADGLEATQNPVTLPVTVTGSVTGVFVQDTQPPGGTFTLKVNNQLGSIAVDENSMLQLEVSGVGVDVIAGGAYVEIRVDELFPLPDSILASGKATTQGIFTSSALIGKARWVITAYQLGVVPGTVTKTSNTVTVTAGTAAGNDLMTLAIIGVAGLLAGFLFGGRR